MQETIEILQKEWSFLNDGIQSAGHHYHSFIFSTIRNNAPELRTVILRSVDENSSSIHFHSDIRSKKIVDIEKNNSVGALFYDSSRRIQLRIQGLASVESNNDKTKKVWQSMRNESKLCYMGPFAPSSTMKSFLPNLPNNPLNKINQNDDKLGYSRFCRVKIVIKTIDWLQLHHKGHKRLLFKFEDKVRSKWIAS